MNQITNKLQFNEFFERYNKVISSCIFKNVDIEQRRTEKRDDGLYPKLHKIALNNIGRILCKVNTKLRKDLILNS